MGPPIKHGHSLKGKVTAAYRRWCDMHTRCYNPKSKSFKYYGGKGVRVCESWGQFENFYADMGDPPPGRVIDRINSDGDYCKENCRWATTSQQRANQKNTRQITYRGQTRLLFEWAKMLGVRRELIAQRLDRLGWSVERALTIPSKQLKNKPLCPATRIN